MGKKSLDKGKRVEREAVKLFKSLFEDVKRNWEEQMLRSCKRDLSNTYPLYIQIKAGKAPSWRKAMNEAEQGVVEDKCPDEIPVGLTKQDGDEFYVHLKAKDFIALLQGDVA